MPGPVVSVQRDGGQDGRGNWSGGYAEPSGAMAIVGGIIISVSL